jgi:hypothetical protein
LDSSWTPRPLKMGPISYPETSVNNNQSRLRNIPEQGISHLHGDGSLKSHLHTQLHRLQLWQVKVEDLLQLRLTVFMEKLGNETG